MSNITPHDYWVQCDKSMRELLRARHDAGIKASDPLDPLVVALASTVATIGQLPAALAAGQTAAEQKAVENLSAVLQGKLSQLVDQLGGKVVEASWAKSIAICAAILAVICGGAFWYAYHCAEQYADAKIEIAKNDYKNSIEQITFNKDPLSAWAITKIYPFTPSDKAPWPCVSWDDVKNVTDNNTGKEFATCRIALRDVKIVR